MRTIDIKRAVSDNRKCTFSHFADNQLHYQTEFGEVFGIPLSETNGAIFNAEEKALLLMRFMRKWNKAIEQAKEESNAE